MAKTKCGLFGSIEFERDENGFVELLVIFQESGLFAGAPPLEMRIHCIVPFNDKNFGEQYCAKLNQKADLPFYLGKVKVKVVGEPRKITDADLLKAGLEPLK
jgi:hypothetical protein